MQLLNKFQEHKFLNGFQTHNSILDTVPYEPEVIFIGTYNHGWSWNKSDFFFGRGMYMWTVLANMFIFNNNHLIHPRNSNNPYPSIDQIFEICKKGKIVFANIVKGPKSDIEVAQHPNKQYVIVNKNYKWGSSVIGNKKVGGYSDNHIENLGKSEWLDDNLDAIIEYINDTASIRHIYFTFKSGSWLNKKINILAGNLRTDVTCCSIFTPTAKGFGYLLDSPFDKRAWGLSHCWVWNGLEHSSFINKVGYGHLDHSWLIGTGVDPNNF